MTTTRPQPRANRSIRRAGNAGALAAAVVLSVVLLPHSLQPRSEGEFISQVIEARAEIPQLSVTSFHAPGDRGVVLWIEGSDFIPSEEAVR